MASRNYTAPTLSADGETADAADLNGVNNATLAGFEGVEAELDALDDFVTDAETAQTAAEAAQTAAEAAQTAAEAAQTSAETAQTNAETAETNAETAQAAAEAAVDRGFSISLFGSGTQISTGDGTNAFCVPNALDGYNITDCVASVYTAGTTGTTDIQIRRSRAGADVDVLSTKLTIDSGETSSTTAATAFVINTSNDDLAEGDLIFIDVDAVQTTAPYGLSVTVMAEAA